MNFSGEGGESERSGSRFAPPDGQPVHRLAAAPESQIRQLDPVLEEALRQPSSKDSLLRMERGVQDFLRDSSCVLPHAMYSHLRTIASSGMLSLAALRDSRCHRWVATIA